MTIVELLRTPHASRRVVCTPDKFKVLMRADVAIPFGRYFGGQLSDAELAALTDGLESYREGEAA